MGGSVTGKLNSLHIQPPIAKKKNTKNKAQLNFLKLPSDAEVKVMTMEQYDQIVTNITKVRNLTTEELNETVLQRRRIKNRISAKQSRKKKQVEVSSMGQELSNLRKENEFLTEKVRKLEKDNETLREIIKSHEQAQNTIPKMEPIDSSGGFELTFNDIDIESNSTSPSALSYLSALDSPSSFWQINSNPAAKGSICLFIVLLTFGLFLNSSYVVPTFQNPLPPIPVNSFSPGKIISTPEDNLVQNFQKHQNFIRTRNLFGMEETENETYSVNSLMDETENDTVSGYNPDLTEWNTPLAIPVPEGEFLTAFIDQTHEKLFAPISPIGTSIELWVTGFPVENSYLKVTAQITETLLVAL